MPGTHLNASCRWAHVACDRANPDPARCHCLAWHWCRGRGVVGAAAPLPLLRSPRPPPDWSRSCCWWRYDVVIRTILRPPAWSCSAPIHNHWSSDWDSRCCDAVSSVASSGSSRCRSSDGCDSRYSVHSDLAPNRWIRRDSLLHIRLGCQLRSCALPDHHRHHWRHSSSANRPEHWSRCCPGRSAGTAARHARREQPARHVISDPVRSSAPDDAPWRLECIPVKRAKHTLVYSNIEKKKTGTKEREIQYLPPATRTSPRGHRRSARARDPRGPAAVRWRCTSADWAIPPSPRPPAWPEMITSECRQN